MTTHNRYLLVVLVLGCCTLPFANASFSLVATDSKTRQVGAVGASCQLNWDPAWDVYKTSYVSVPNRSVLHIQGGGVQAFRFDGKSPLSIVAKNKMLEDDSTIQEVFESMKEYDALKNASVKEYDVWGVDDRQYIMADFESSAAFSGSNLGVFENELELDDIGIVKNDRYHAHAAGHFVKFGTVAALIEGFQNAENLGFVKATPWGIQMDDLAGRLMSALWNVVFSAKQLGDDWCRRGYGVTSSGAYIHIDNPDGTTLLHINIAYTKLNGIDPADTLYGHFFEWRDNNVSPDVEWTYEYIEEQGDDDDDYDTSTGQKIMVQLVRPFIFLLVFCFCFFVYKYCYKGNRNYDDES